METVQPVIEGAVYIYALVDPRNPTDYRYVGQTHKSIETRLKWHIRDACAGFRTHNYNWIRKIIRDGVFPEAIILEICNEDTWKERESYWISKIRLEGYRLTNATAGGDGTVGYHHTQETKDRLRILGRAQKLRPMSVRQRSALRIANTGKVMKQEVKDKISIAKTGVRETEEHKNNIRRGHLIRTLSRRIAYCREMGLEIEVSNSDDGLKIVVKNAHICSGCTTFVYGSSDLMCDKCLGIEKSTRARWVDQIDIETGCVVATYKSAHSAMLALGGSNGSIGMALKFSYKTAYGYYWDYTAPEDLICDDCRTASTRDGAGQVVGSK